MDQFQDRGRQAYKRGEYKDAIQHFDRAIGRTPSVRLHDNRAACYEKLGNFSDALKDAKQAIQTCKEDPTGYLRAGRVLVKMDKKSVASEVYSRGLKSIKHVGQGYEALRKAHSELLSELSPVRSIDPLTVLPPEIAQMVLNHLSFRQLMNACMVSKAWAHFIRCTPDLWSHIDLTGAQRKVKNAFISRAINVARSKLVKATFNDLFDVEKALAAIVRHCPLEELTLLRTGKHGDNLATILSNADHLTSIHFTSGTHVSGEALARILRDAANRLRSARGITMDCTFKSLPIFTGLDFPQLQDLGLCFYDNIFSSLYNLAGITQLRSLQLQVRHTTSGWLTFADFRLLEQLEKLDIQAHAIDSRLLRVPCSLKSLKLHTHAMLFSPSPETLFDEWFLPSLTELDLVILRKRITARQLNALLSLQHTEASASLHDHSQASTISSLTVSMDLTIDDAQGLHDLTDLVSGSRLRGLQHLSLQGSLNCDDDVLIMIAKEQPGLRFLDISLTDVTGVGVKQAVESCRLESLRINDCRKMSPDVAQWARSRGVRVEHRTSASLKSERKIRLQNA